MIEYFKNFLKKSDPVWSGDYQNWEEASAHCTNYENASILKKVKAALIEVRDGRAAFERDSVLFQTPDYNWPLLSTLLWAFGKESNTLTILDFGGSLGSTYFQHRQWFNSCPIPGT